MKRNITLIVLVCLISAVALAGCARNNNTPSPSPSLSPLISASPAASPTPITSTSPTLLPNTSPGTSVSPGDNGSASTDTENNAQAAEAIKKELDKMSEVKEAHVVVLGNVALVGIEFDGQYQGGVTDRVNEMVVEKANAASDTIVDVVITDTADHVKSIKALAEKTGEAIHKEVAEIIEKIKNAA